MVFCEVLGEQWNGEVELAAAGLQMRLFWDERLAVNGYSARVFGAMAALLLSLDGEPLLARVCLLETLAGSPARTSAGALAHASR
jgi:hypothetical protein